MAGFPEDGNALKCRYCVIDIIILLPTELLEWFWLCISPGFNPGGFYTEENNQKCEELYLHNKDSKIYFKWTAEAAGLLLK